MSESLAMSSDSSHSSCTTLQLSFTLANDTALTVHLVGHSVLKPGVSDDNLLLSLSNIPPCQDEYFRKFDTFRVVLSAFFRHLTFFTTLPVAKFKACL